MSKNMDAKLLSKIAAGQMHRNMVASVPQLARGQVWCTKCGATQKVDSAGALRNGWPKCCGYTMTIDSPEERARR